MLQVGLVIRMCINVTSRQYLGSGEVSDVHS
jgi:hypothetical protein